MTRPSWIRREHGFTLVELVVFIVILGVAAVALFKMFGQVLPQSPQPAQLEQATQLAQERVELILGQRDASGYGPAELDPCKKTGPPAICTTTLGYSVSSAGTTLGSEVAWNGNPTTGIGAFKLITVTVKLGVTQLAQQSVVLANY
jgi:prepilin-type N-terminal cleavage/methylation domain-containing protein